uniref:Uncharacterized protein n=1 Tax=Arundo donax TaxID=35708 RepID=A0A0A9D757_ARUDO
MRRPSPRRGRGRARSAAWGPPRCSRSSTSSPRASSGRSPSSAQNSMTWKARRLGT